MFGDSFPLLIKTILYFFLIFYLRLNLSITLVFSIKLLSKNLIFILLKRLFNYIIIKQQHYIFTKIACRVIFYFVLFCFYYSLFYFNFIKFKMISLHLKDKMRAKIQIKTIKVHRDFFFFFLFFLKLFHNSIEGQ